MLQQTIYLDKAKQVPVSLDESPVIETEKTAIDGKQCPGIQKRLSHLQVFECILKHLHSNPHRHIRNNS